MLNLGRAAENDSVRDRSDRLLKAKNISPLIVTSPTKPAQGSHARCAPRSHTCSKPVAGVECSPWKCAQRHCSCSTWSPERNHETGVRPRHKCNRSCLPLHRLHSRQRSPRGKSAQCVQLCHTCSIPGWIRHRHHHWIPILRLKCRRLGCWGNHGKCVQARCTCSTSWASPPSCSHAKRALLLHSCSRWACPPWGTGQPGDRLTDSSKNTHPRFKARQNEVEQNFIEEGV